MSLLFEELGFEKTPIGEISLRRRKISALGGLDVYEVKLGEEYLMSSLFADAEIALSDLGLAEVKGENLDVVVGGLGLGYTAVAALKHQSVGSLIVVEYLDPVIQWHQKELVPLGKDLNADKRCRLVQGDFFALAADPAKGFDPKKPSRRFHAVLLDVDHSPRHFLHPHSRPFYEKEGLSLLREQLHPGGVFALWSNDPPDEVFLGTMRQVFENVRAVVVDFPNPLTRQTSSNSIYLGTKSK